MRVHPADPLAPYPMRFQCVKHLGIIGGNRRRQAGEKIERLLPIRQSSASQFSHHKRMREHLIGFQHRPQFRVPAAEVIDPNRGIDQRHLRSSHGRTPAWNRLDLRRRPAQGRQPPRRLARNQGAQGRVYQCCLLLNTGETAGLPDQCFVQIQRAPHAYKYA